MWGKKVLYMERFCSTNSASAPTKQTQNPSARCLRTTWKNGEGIRLGKYRGGGDYWGYIVGIITTWPDIGIGWKPNYPYWEMVTLPWDAHSGMTTDIYQLVNLAHTHTQTYNTYTCVVYQCVHHYTYVYIYVYLHTVSHCTRILHDLPYIID